MHIKLDHIIMENGAPIHVRAYAYNRLLWDAQTRRPLVDPAKLATLPQYDRDKVQQLINMHPPIEVDALLSSVRHTAFSKRIAWRLARKAGDVKSPLRFQLRREFKEKFYYVSRLSKEPIIRATAYGEPPNAPLAHKVATRNYNFTPREIRELCAMSEQLVALERFELIRVLRTTGQWPERRGMYLLPPGSLDGTARDPVIKSLDVAIRFYRLKNEDNLQRMAFFFGSGSHLLRFAAARAAARQTSIAAQMRELSQVKPPTTTEFTPHLWRGLFLRQLQSPFDAKQDLFGICYEQMDAAQRWLAEHGINMRTVTTERLLAAAQELPYRQAARHPELATLCREWRIPEARFDKGVGVMEKRSLTDEMPLADLSLAELGLPGYRLVKLDKRDPMALLAGNYVNSCTHIGGTFNNAAAVVTEPDVGCYVIVRPGDGRIVVKMNCWLTERRPDGQRDFTVNAWYANDAVVEAKRDATLTFFATKMLAADAGLRRVLVGGVLKNPPFPANVPSVRPRAKAAEHKKDLKHQYIVLQR